MTDLQKKSDALFASMTATLTRVVIDGAVWWVGK